jgi:hypothetical protein
MQQTLHWYLILAKCCRRSSRHTSISPTVRPHFGVAVGRRTRVQRRIRIILVLHLVQMMTQAVRGARVGKTFHVFLQEFGRNSIVIPAGFKVRVSIVASTGTIYTIQEA